MLARRKIASLIRTVAWSVYTFPDNMRMRAKAAAYQAYKATLAFSGKVSGCGCLADDPRACAEDGDWCECHCHEENADLGRALAEQDQ